MPTLSLSKNQGSRAGTRDIYHVLPRLACLAAPADSAGLLGARRARAWGGRVGNTRDGKDELQIVTRSP